MRNSKYKVQIQSGLIALAVSLLVAAPISGAESSAVQSAVKIVHGKPGKTGKRGPQGFAGPVGPQGVPGKDAPKLDPYGPVQILPGATATVLSECPIPSESSHKSAIASAGPLPIVRDGWFSSTPVYFAIFSNTTNDPVVAQAFASCW